MKNSTTDNATISLLFQTDICSANTSDYRLPLHSRRTGSNNTFRLGSRDHFKSWSLFGKLSWDSERKMIGAVPLIITNMRS